MTWMTGPDRSKGDSLEMDTETSQRSVGFWRTGRLFEGDFLNAFFSLLSSDLHETGLSMVRGSRVLAGSLLRLIE